MRYTREARRARKGLAIDSATHVDDTDTGYIPCLPRTPSYTFCTTATEVARACALLRPAPYILVDCEGGDANGPSLLQLGTPHATDVFLFDFLALSSRESRAGITALLDDPRIVKVFWDGRSDYSALLSACGARTAPTLDLQLVDIYSRAVRQHSHGAQLARLSRHDSPLKTIIKLQLDGVHVLNSMDGAIREHRVDVPLKDSAVTRMHKEGRADEWLRRPLPGLFLDYAAADITRIGALYHHFENRGYLEPNAAAALRDGSDLYYRTTPPMTPEEKEVGNVFKRSGILPMNIFPSSFDFHAPTAPIPQSSSAREITCDKCTRRLPSSCFPYRLTAKESKQYVDNGRFFGPASRFPRSSSCAVCTLHLERQKRTRVWEKAERFKERGRRRREERERSQAIEQRSKNRGIGSRRKEKQKHDSQRRKKRSSGPARGM